LSRASGRRTVGRAARPADAADFLAGRLGGLEPRVAIVLGSGLGGLADRIGDAVRVPCAEIPGWPASGVEGHAGQVVAGRLGGVPVLGLAGRAHLYEGHAPSSVVLPVRVAARLGARTLFVSNAAGAVNPLFEPGDLMLISDHINLMGRSPLAGPPEPGEPRWPDVAGGYDPGLRDAVRETARAERIGLREGVYAGMLGPSYETPAEIDMLRRLGADAVGMSTVPEVIAARALGIGCVGVSCLTNCAAGVSPGPLRHEEVLETAREAAETFERLVLRSLPSLAAAARPPADEPLPDGPGRASPGAGQEA